MSASRRRCLRRPRCRCAAAAAMQASWRSGRPIVTRSNRSASTQPSEQPRQSTQARRDGRGVGRQAGDDPGYSPRSHRRSDGLGGLSATPFALPPPPPLGRPVAARPPHPISSQHPCLAHRRFKPAGGAARCEPRGPGAPCGHPRPRPAAAAGAGASGGAPARTKPHAPHSLQRCTPACRKLRCGCSVQRNRRDRRLVSQ